MKTRPRQQGLYIPEFEHDNCGIGFVTQIRGKKSHEIIRMGLEVLENMTHRGAEGADSKTGDGAGILIQIPRDFYLIQGYNVPPEGQFGTGILFLPRDEKQAGQCLGIFEGIMAGEGINVIDYRDVPRNNKVIGDLARTVEPEMSDVDLDIKRATAALDLTTGADHRGMADVLTAIHDTADVRGKRIGEYVNAAKEFFKDMQEIAGT